MDCIYKGIGENMNEYNERGIKSFKEKNLNELNKKIFYDFNEKNIDKLGEKNKIFEKRLEEIFKDPDTIIKIAKNLKEEQNKNKKMENENNRNKEIINELKSKAQYADFILACKETMTVTAIAKEYGMSAKSFNQKLHDLKIQYKQGGQWFLYRQYQNFGYTYNKAINYLTPNGNFGIKFNTEWTQKGRMFLYNKLKENGIIPLAEKDMN